MQVKFTKQFDKQFDKIADKTLKKKISDAVSSAISADKIADIPNIKKLQGHDTSYRIRIGDYRIGLRLDNSVVIFVVVEHRKDIYRHFP